MNSALHCRLFTLLAMVAILSCPAFASTPVAVLDNTAGGTNTLNPGTGSEIFSIGDTQKAIVFTTPNTGSEQLTAFRFGFQEGAGGSDFSFTVNLEAVDGSDIPTGSPLATMSTDVTVSTTPTYFTFDLTTLPGSTFNNVDLQTGTAYALILSGTGGVDNKFSYWNAAVGNPAPTTAGGFAFDKVEVSEDGGETWDPSGSINALTFYTISSPVPEPANALLAGILTVLVLGLVLRRQALR